MGPRTLYFQRLEGCTELGSYVGARKVKLWYSVCLQWPNIHLISLHARLFTPPPLSRDLEIAQPSSPSPRSPDIPTPSASGELIFQVTCLAPHVYTCRLHGEGPSERDVDVQQIIVKTCRTRDEIKVKALGPVCHLERKVFSLYNSSSGADIMQCYISKSVNVLN